MSERCSATLVIWPDRGGAHPATMTCCKTKDHEGKHEESFDAKHNDVTVTWIGDSRKDKT